MRPDKDPDWRDLLMLIRYIWRVSPTGRWFLAGTALALQFLYITPQSATQDVMITLLFLGFLLIAARSGGLGG